jgi:integrase
MSALSTLVGTAKRARRRVHGKQLTAVAQEAMPAKPDKGVRINGPYPEKGKWRIYLIDDSGRKAFLYASRDEAEQMKAKLTAKAQLLVERTVGECIDAHLDYSLRVRGALRSTADSVRFHLNTLLPRDVPVAALTADRAAQLYADFAQRRHHRTGKPLSVATHHYVLLLAKGWGRWLLKTGAVTANPFSAVEPVGKPRAGKPQLTRDEAQRLSQLAVSRAAAGDIHAVGVLLMLHMGLRQGEVGARTVRDVDHDGQVLIIPFGKTASARRRLKVPAWLQPFLRRLLAHKTPSDLLFPSECQRVHHRQFWWNKVQQLCDAAAVPRVCPHSLRGLHATLAIEEGASGEAVARALGHTSFDMTAKHYAQADSVENARVDRASQMLSPQPAPPASNRITQLLTQLTAEERHALHELL